MRVPESLQKNTLRERKQARARIERDAERKRKTMHLPPNPQFGRKPSGIFAILLVMIVVGGLMITRVARPPQIPIRRSSELVAANELHNLRIAVERFHKDCGRYPSTPEGLVALVRNPGVPGWSGPYVNLIKPDPWRHPYQYSCSGNNLILFSLGTDGKNGTTDDIVPEEPTTEEVRRD